ncbi:hypothetical protein BK131_14095 [Paenibacillus amylolyticus]|uniref:SLH domain-containing protein n=1 Tax=Paenibacillus amylolyticus TaxID=1451 RepID=A0A1R1BVA0_PAEAM|nr:DUF4073 domain-containing protein [Paenibacillus amylolyticus]OMF13792.1 hypothetical protein BK131_14095 [Paenibacillus amylolyticus]
MKTYARKIISAVLVLLMLIQVVAVVPVQANPMTPLEKLNYAISEGSVSEIQEVLEGNLIVTLPLGYSGLSIQEKEAIARLVATLPKGEAYSSEEQLEYTFNLAYQGMILISNTDLFAIQLQMDLVYSLLSQSKNYFTNDTTEMMYKSGVKYEEMSGVDRQIISHFIQMTLIAFHGSEGSTELDNAFFQVIFGITGYPEINKAKVEELMLETLNFNQFFKGSIDEFIDDNPESGAVAYPLDFDKLKSIQEDSEQMTELANWMIEKMPQGGFASIEDIQKSFDQFFNSAAPLVTVDDDVNVIVGADDTMEYTQNNGENWFDYSTTNPPEFKGNKTVWVRVKANESNAASLYEILIFTENKETDPLESLNLAKSNEDVEGVLSEIQDSALGLELPVDFSDWSNDEKESVAVFVTLMNGAKGYVSKGQVQYVLDMAVEPRNLFNKPALTDVEENINAYFSKLLNLPEVFSINLDPSIQSLYKVGKTYENLSVVDKQIFAYRMKFYSMRDEIPSYQNRDQLSTSLSTYNAINDVTNQTKMYNALVRLRLVQKESTQYNNLPSTIKYMVEFPLNMDKVDSIDYATYRKLAQWMIDKRPVGGYENYKNIQKTFDQFFNPADPLRVINEARATKNTDAILGAITQPEWLDLPAGFDILQPEEKKAIANVVMTFLPIDYAYDLKKQVQYAVEIGYKGIQTIKQTDKILFQQHLNEFYSLFVESTEYFEYPGMEMFKELGQKYLNASNVDKELLAYTAKRLFQGSDLSIEQVYGASLMLVMNYSYINDAIDVSEMKKAMLMLYSFQQSTEMMEPFEPFLLKLNAMKDLVEDDTRMGKLAQWMLDRKSANGYSSISEVQTAFDRFFDQIIIITPTPTPSNGGGGTGSTPVTSTPAPTTKQEQIVVDVNGTNGTNLTKTPITRTTETNGMIKDLVKMTEAIAKESVEKAKQLNMNTARIVIPDTKDSVSETRIELPKAAVKELNDGSLKLEISTENVVISVPTNSIAGFDQDLYFRVVPLKQESQRQEVEERAKKEQLIQQVAPNTNVRVLARPVEIDTNMQSREVTLTLPLRGSLPTDPTARQQALDNLAIYIEHSDGTKELIQGKLVQLADNSEGIEFTVTKFSTFTLVVVDGLKASQGTHQPYIQGFGADFRPDAFVTRAQMAAMLARNLPTEAAAGSANSVSYKDVSATHWATSEIQKAQSAGIMNGMSNTQFAPEGSITRAQMATIAHRWMQQQASATTVNGPAVSFTDVSADLWAAEAIAYVQSAGLMVGYNDGTFKPDSKLTRAEAVKVLNVLFNRTPLTGVATPTFSDVTASHWAYADIEAAAQK